MKRQAALFLAFALASGCRESPPAAPRPAPSPTPAVITDDEGISHSRQAPPRRIVSLAPHLTEILFWLGAGDRVVGVSQGETYPPESTALPVVTRPDSPEPDVARIVQFRTDLVVAAGFPGAPFKQQLRDLGIPVATFNAAGVHDAVSDMAVVARLVGVQGEKHTANLKQQLEAATETAEQPQVRIFVENFYPPLTGAGRGGFVEDLVRAAGGLLIGPPPPSETFEWTAEMVAAEAPRLYLAPLSTAPDEKSVRARPGFGVLRKIPISVLDDDLLFRPGPRMPKAINKIASVLAGAAPAS